jgi:hypothetical protein
MNLEIWGSFEPLNSQCYDIELTRAGAYTKIVQLRKRLEIMANFWHSKELGPDERELKVLADHTKHFAELI